MDTSYKRIIALSLPVLIANIAIPIQGAIDMAIVGHFDADYYLAGIGLAIQIITVLLVSFNFLQYATSGQSAQIKGKTENSPTIQPLVNILKRGLVIALFIGSFIFISRFLFISPLLHLMSADGLTYQVAYDYIDIRMYGIIAELMNYVLLGWFAGQGQTKLMLLQQTIIAISNIILTVCFVFVFDLGMIGVALGTVIAYWVGITFSFINIKKILKIDIKSLLSINIESFKKNDIKSLFSLNKDIFIRTTLLTLSFAWITKLSSELGQNILATNTLLLQILTLSAYALDSVAVSAESLSGQSFGKKDWISFHNIIIKTGITSFSLATLLSIIWWLLFPNFLSLMTNIDSIYTLAYSYRWFAILLPIIGVGAYWLDGIFFGLTAGTDIRNVAILVAIIFFPTSYLLFNKFQLLGVWLSVWLFLLLRFIIMGALLIKKYYK